MPLFYQHNINEHTKLGVWHIQEDEHFFLKQVPLKADIRHPNKRLQHLAGRYLLHLLFPDFPYHLIEIADTRKPYLPNEMYHFSISHCGQYAAAIVSRDQRVGIDIELPKPMILKIQHKFVNASEWSFMNGQNDILDLTILWSAKEAVFKWAGNESVDFKDHIKLIPESLKHKTGTFNCDYLKNGSETLTLHYHKFDEVVLVWVVSN